MAKITAKNLGIEFPVYGASNRSIKEAAINTFTGGMIKGSKENEIIVEALEDISFELNDGDRLGLIGNNGSGKTTLLRCLAGSYSPTRGSLFVDGKISSMISITLGLEGDATGVENIKLRGTLLGLKKYEIDSLIEDVIDFADLGKFIHMPMRVYSSGMMMRLAFGIATGISSEILIMDEWLSVGDANFSEKSEKRLNQLLSNSKILVIATHNSALVTSICNQAIHLDQGRIISHSNF